MEDISFSADALSSLTKKIASNAGPSKGKSSTAKARIAQTEKKNAGKDQNGDTVEKKANVQKSKKDKKQKNQSEQLQSNIETKAVNGQADSVKHKSQKSASKEPIEGKAVKEKGKKRLRDGKIKEDQTKSFKAKGAKGLREEVLALGGTEEDFDYINGGESESEVEGTKDGTDKALNKDLKKMIKELGIAGAAADHAVQSSEEEDEEMDDAPEVANPNEIAVVERRPKTELDPTKSKSGLVFQPRSEWHTAELPLIDEIKSSDPITDEDVERLHEFAKELLRQEGGAYSAMNKSSSAAHQFYSTIMSSGTLSDKVSALTLSVQDSPLHNQQAFDTLLGLVKKRNRTQALEVLTALKDLIGPGSLLPSDRKLRPFSSQPGLSAVDAKQALKWQTHQPLPSPLKPVHLVSWAFEDYLKSCYFEILKVLETWCNDEIVFARTKAVDIVFDLLRDKPEQEANLLRLLVYKLGDTEKKIASRASYNLLQLQLPHPFMKPTVISAIEADILFKPGQTSHAKYYAIITLNQTVLSSKEDAVVQKVLDIYFSMFLNLLNKPEPVQQQQQPEKTTMNKKGERQGGGGKPGKMALKKQQESNKPPSSTPDEQIRDRMMSAVLTGINRAVPYADINDEFFAKNLETLFKVTHSANFNTSIQALMLIQQLCGSHQAASDRFYRTLYESLLDPRLLTTSKHILYLNLLYRALRADLSVKRVKAFVKRLLQVIAMHQPPFACAVLYLLRELESVFPSLKLFVDEPEEGDDEEEERYQDVPENDNESEAGSVSNERSGPKIHYDGRKRAPEHSNADKSCLWELSSLIEHHHPSVALFAKKLLEHEPMPPKPSLESLTLIHFLDRFVYKNPKKATGKLHGSSVMQPMPGADTSSLLVTAGRKADMVPVNSDAFYKMSGEKVGAEDIFFHKYFNAKAKGQESAKAKKEKKKRKANADSDEDSDEDEIWQALVESRPELEGAEDDEDVDMDDFSDEGDGSDGGVEMFDSEDEDGDAGEGMGEDADEDDSEGFDFEDEDGALLGSDDELPSDLDEALKKAPEPEETKTLESLVSITKGREKRSERKKRLKNLPTFASAEDYAALLGDDGNQDV